MTLRSSYKVRVKKTDVSTFVYYKILIKDEESWYKPKSMDYRNSYSILVLGLNKNPEGT